MNTKKYESLLVDLNKNVKIWFSMTVTLLAVVLLQSFYLIKVDNREKTIITPPHLKKSFTIHGNLVSPSYLEQMTFYFANLLFTYNPSNASVQIESLLHYVIPSYYSELKSHLTTDLEKIARQDMSSVFYPKTIHVQGMKVQVTGTHQGLIGRKVVSHKERTYEFIYKYINDILYIKSYKEVQHEK